jgi:hypothetical protein
MGDDRRYIRDDVDETAFISSQGHSIRCRLRNLSPGGAAIDVPDAAEVPSKFRLMTQSDRQTYDCRIVWIKLNRIGVAFEQVAK